MTQSPRYALILVLCGASCSGAIGASDPGAAGDPPRPAAEGPSLPGAVPSGTPPTSGAPPSTPATPGTPAVPGAPPAAEPSFPKPVPGADPFLDPAGKLRDGAGEMPLRRLSKIEYGNTIKDLFGETLSLEGLPADAPDASGFSSGPNVSPVEAAAFVEYAEKVAASAAPKLATLLPCQPAAGREETCAAEFVKSFGKRVYRRPVTDAEATALVDLYRRGRTDARLDFNGAIGLVIQGMLLSPRFLYHWQQGSAAPTLDGALVRLGPYEVASRLSYLFTQSMPDAELFAAADKGALATDEQRAEQARRLLATPRARPAVVSFLEQWLGLTNLGLVGKDTKRYPTFDDDLLLDMGAETRAFLDAVLFTEDARWATLMSAGFSFVNQRLARVYGLSGVTGTNLRRVPVDPAQRGGILTQPSLLSVYASAQEGSPIKRGLLVRQRFICQTPPPVPSDVPPLPDPVPGLPTREHFAEHSKNPACGVCHRLMDPIGFGFLRFDAIGAWQTMDGNRPVDATGSVTDIDGKAKVDFDGVKQLSAILADSAEVQACLTRQAFRYALGRPESLEDGASLSRALSGFQTQGNIKDLMIAVTRSRAFAHRSPSPGEVLK